MPGLTYIMAILYIEKTPESVYYESKCSTNVQLGHIHRHNGIDDCEAPIEG